MLTRWDPFNEFNRIQNSFLRANSNNESFFRPAVDIRETDEAYKIEVEVPGLKSEEVSIEVEKSTLVLRGERKLETKKEGENVHRVERRYGSFSRSFALPENIDEESISASLDNGVLELTLPKRETAGTRKIDIAV